MRVGVLTVLLSLVALPQASGKDISIEVAKDSFLRPSASHFTAAAEELARKTGNQVTLDFTDGGKDEDKIVARLVAATIDGCVLSAGGLQLLLPDARVLDLPFLFADTKERDAGRAAIKADLDAVLAAAGYVNLGWISTGTVRLYSKVEIKTIGDLRNTKMGLVTGDPIMSSYLGHLGVSPVQIVRGGDISTLADEGKIDALHATPVTGLLAMLAYVTARPIAWPTGAFIVRKDVFDALSAIDQQSLRDVARDATAIQRKNTDTARVKVSRNNQDSNPTESATPQALLDEMRVAAEKTWIEHAGSLYDVALLNKILKAKGDQEIDTATVPARVVTIQRAASKRYVAAAVYQGDGSDEALTLALGDAPEDLRALRLALEDCDAAMMTEWIRFPLRVGATQYKGAAELSKACATGDVPQLAAAELEAGIRNPSLSGTDLRLRIDRQDWRFVWSGKQWWLTEIASF